MSRSEPFLDGERDVARLITRLEAGDVAAHERLAALNPLVGRAAIIGITGPPGAGKSSLVDHLISNLREAGRSVGVLAVDPSSPYSGGAVLGDRIRMQRHDLDPEVFIRSVAARNAMGGLTSTATAIVRLLDAWGKDVVLIETVGVGQSELDIVAAADTVVVVLVPEGGDGVQVMKSGLMEIADIFVVNKADRPGAGEVVTHLEGLLRTRAEVQHLDARDPSIWSVPVIETRADVGEGVAAVMHAMTDHTDFLKRSGHLEERRQRRRVAEFDRIILDELVLRLRRWMRCDGVARLRLEGVEDGSRDPYTAAREVLAMVAERPGSLRRLDLNIQGGAS